MAQRKFFQQVCGRMWWVVLFIGTSLAVYAHALQEKQGVISGLEKHLSQLSSQRHVITQQREDLLAQIQSQSDPAWIELTLMKGLGVVPEGQKKVYFYDHLKE